MADLLHIRQDGRLLRITLHRPEKRNALHIHLCRQLVETLDRADDDPRVGAILLDGAGKAFCAGMDLDEVLAAPTAEINAVHQQLFSAGERLSTPLIAAVHGAALGGGTGLAAICHIVVAAPDAQLGLTEIRLGLWPFLVFRPVALAVGERRAIELALTGRIFGAEEARNYGLVHEIAADPVARAEQIGFVSSNFSPDAIRAGLGFVRQVRTGAAEAIALAQDYRNQIFAGADFAEGVRAFQEKRAPQWPSLKEPTP